MHYSVLSKLLILLILFFKLSNINSEKLALPFVKIRSKTIVNEEIDSALPPSDITYEPLLLRNFSVGILPDRRIIGGYRASENDYPGIVSIQEKPDHHICGGTLITMSFVLTAAHCVVNNFYDIIEPSSLLIVGDTLILGGKSAKRNCKTILVHSDYDQYTFKNDIGILQLRTPFTRNDKFHEIERLYERPQPDTECYVAGWGYTKYRGEGSVHLLETNIFIVETSICNESYKGFITNKMVCAGVKTGARDSCQGDSGGALYCDGKITGIVSFGKGCGIAYYPAVHTDITYYNKWVDDCLNFMKYKQTDVHIHSSNSDLKINYQLLIFIVIANLFFFSVCLLI